MALWGIIVIKYTFSVTLRTWDTISLEWTITIGEYTMMGNSGGGQAFQTIDITVDAWPFDVRCGVATKLFDAAVWTMNWEWSRHCRNRDNDKWGKLWPLALDGEHNGNKIAIGSVADDIWDQADIVQNRSNTNYMYWIIRTAVK